MKSAEMKWMELFETKKAEAQAIKAEIDAADCEICEMVYELYGLSKDEIAVLENSVEQYRFNVRITYYQLFIIL